MSLCTYVTFQGRNDEADPFYLRAIQIEETALGQDHPDLAKNLSNRAGLLQEMVSHDIFLSEDPLFTEVLWGSPRP